MILNGPGRAARTEDQVGADGNSNRYDESMCWHVIPKKVA